MQTVLVDRPVEGVARLTLNRPQVLNAINRELLADLTTAVDEVERDSSVAAVILTGAGRAFSSGFDLKAEASEGSLSIETWEQRFRADWKVFLRIWQSPLPFVAAVRGYNLGGALELSLLCDVTLAARGTKFGAPEIRHGSGPGAAMLPWLIGMKAAKYVLLTGNMVEAEDAWRMGIVTEVVDPDELDERSVTLAANLAAIPPEVMKLNKIAINRTYERLGMLATIEDNYMISTVVNGTSAYRAMEQQRQQMPLGEFVRHRDKSYDK